MNQATIDKVNQLLHNISCIPGYSEDKGEVVVIIGQHLKGSARYIDVIFKTVEKIELSEGCSVGKMVEQRIDRNATQRCIKSNGVL